MKRILSVCLLILLSTLTCITAYAKAEQQLDQVVAIVNDDIITKSELNQALAMAKAQINQAGAPMPSNEVLEKQVVDQLINKRLQLQVAKQVGIQIPDADLDNAIQNIASRNQLTLNDFYKRLSQEGMSKTDYRNDVRDQMALQKLQQQEVISHINISPDEVNHFMRSKIWQRNSANEYHLEDILIPLSDEPSTDDITSAKKRAQAIIAKLNQGQDFRKIAQSESSAKNALQGGDLGWRKLPEIPSVFAEQIVHLQPKEIAGPIQAPNGFHIIRLVEVRTANSQEAAPNRKQIEELLLQRKFEEAMQTWVSKLRSQAFIVTNPNQS